MPRDEERKPHAAEHHAPKAHPKHGDAPGLMSEAMIAKRVDLHRRIIRVEGTGEATTLITIAKNVDDVVIPEGTPGSGPGYVVGLEERFWVKEVSEDQRTVIAVVNVIPEAFHDKHYDTAVLNASQMPASLQPKTMEHETKARIVGVRIVPKNPNIVGDEAQMCRIMIAFGRRFGGDFGMHGKVVTESGHEVANGSFIVDEAEDRALYANVNLRPDDLKGCNVVLTPLAPLPKPGRHAPH